MKRVIKFAVLFTLAAGVSQAMTVQDILPNTFQHGNSEYVAGTLTNHNSDVKAEPAGEEYLRVAGRRGGGGAARQPGGYSKGAQRQKQRSGNVDVDIDIDNDPNRIIENDAARGVIVGVGIGAAIANSDDPDYTCPDENADGICDDNPG